MPPSNIIPGLRSYIAVSGIPLEVPNPTYDIPCNGRQPLSIIYPTRKSHQSYAIVLSTLESIHSLTRLSWLMDWISYIHITKSMQAFKSVVACLLNQWNMSMSIKYLKKCIKSKFEGLKFAPDKSTKILYLRLPEGADHLETIENINKASFPLNVQLRACLAKNAHKRHDVEPLRIKNATVQHAHHTKTRKRSKTFKQLQPHEVVQSTHHELLLEVQYKYPGLYNLSRKTGHKLLDEIAKILFDRLKNIMSVYLDSRNNCFKLTSHYRKNHPHTGDFQMIVDTLHELQDASGAPRLQISEQELLQQPVKPTIVSIPLETLKATCTRYSSRVLSAITAHVQALDSTIADGDDEKLVARKKVRDELKKILPYMPTIVKQVVAKHFVPKNKQPMHRIRIYGEPYLPSKDAMSPFVRRYHGGASRVIRHRRIYNLLLFKVKQHQYAPLMAMDGTTVAGAKLVIRSDLPTYCASDSLRSEMSAALGGPLDDPILPFNDDMDYEDQEDNNEAPWFLQQSAGQSDVLN